MSTRYIESFQLRMETNLILYFLLGNIEKRLIETDCASRSSSYSYWPSNWNRKTDWIPRFPSTHAVLKYRPIPKDFSLPSRPTKSNGSTFLFDPIIFDLFKKGKRKTTVPFDFDVEPGSIAKPATKTSKTKRSSKSVNARIVSRLWQANLLFFLSYFVWFKEPTNFPHIRYQKVVEKSLQANLKKTKIDYFPMK